jgi:hypothetical protein
MLTSFIRSPSTSHRTITELVLSSSPRSITITGMSPRMTGAVRTSTTAPFGQASQPTTRIPPRPRNAPVGFQREKLLRRGEEAGGGTGGACRAVAGELGVAFIDRVSAGV